MLSEQVRMYGLHNNNPFVSQIDTALHTVLPVESQALGLFLWLLLFLWDGVGWRSLPNLSLSSFGDENELGPSLGVCIQFWIGSLVCKSNQISGSTVRPRCGESKVTLVNLPTNKVTRNKQNSLEIASEACVSLSVFQQNFHTNCVQISFVVKWKKSWLLAWQVLFTRSCTAELTHIHLTLLFITGSFTAFVV